MDEYDKAMLIAYWRTTDKMNAWEEQIAEDKLKAEQAKAK